MGIIWVSMIWVHIIGLLEFLKLQGPNRINGTYGNSGLQQNSYNINKPSNCTTCKKTSTDATIKCFPHRNPVTVSPRNKKNGSTLIFFVWIPLRSFLTLAFRPWSPASEPQIVDFTTLGRHRPSWLSVSLATPLHFCGKEMIIFENRHLQFNHRKQGWVLVFEGYFQETWCRTSKNRVYAAMQIMFKQIYFDYLWKKWRNQRQVKHVLILIKTTRVKLLDSRTSPRETTSNISILHSR